MRANDPYIEWVRAFLESVRAWSPQVPMRMIPFDDRIDKVTRLASRYEFVVHTDHSLTDLDQLGASILHGTGAPRGLFRKLALFWGPFEQFLFLDCDIIVTTEVQRFIATLDELHCDFTYAIPCELEWIYSSTNMQQEARAAGFPSGINTGAWASRRGLFSLDLCKALAAEVQPRRQELVLDGEQSFIIWALYRQHVPVEAFATATGPTGYLWAGDQFNLKTATADGHATLRSEIGAPTFLVHWAGYGLTPLMPYRELWRRYRWRGNSAAAHLQRALDRCRTSVVRMADLVGWGRSIER